MDARRPCPDAALLAAFLDGTLAEYERTAVVTHLTECPQCRAVAVTVVEFHEVEALDRLWEQPVGGDAFHVLPETRSLRWSQEKTRAPALMLALAVLAATALPIYFLIPSWSAQRAVASLVDATVSSRALDARVSGVSTYRPPPLPPDGARPRSSPELITIAARIRDTYAEDDAAASRRAVGLAALLTGDWDAAVDGLELAVAAEPRDARLTNDLAAAYYQRAQRADRPDDLPASLDAAERALQLDGSLLEAWFNRALIITALGLEAESHRAWDAYLARDSQSPWAEEARHRQSRLAARDHAAEWNRLRQSLELDAQLSLVDRAVTDYATRARDYVEHELLARWIAAVKARDPAAADAVLSRIALIGEGFLRHSGDALHVDFVASLRRLSRRDSSAYDEAAAAHEELLRGLQAMSAARFSEAAPALQAAASRLDAVGSPFAARAWIDYWATRYYAMQYESVTQALQVLERASQAQGYVSLEARIAWLKGLTAFARNDFAGAQVGYEQMLAASTTTRDTDQWVMANVLLANLHDMLGDAARAWHYRIAAGSRLERVFSVTTRSVVLGSASGDAQAGEHHAAALLFQSLLCSLPGVPPALEVQARAQRARSLHELGRLEEAAAEVATARARLSAVGDVQGQSRVEADVLAAEAELLLQRDRDGAIAAANRALTLPLLERDHLRRARILLQLAKAGVLDGRLDRAEDALRQGFEALEAFRSQPSAEFAIRASDPVWELYETASEVALRSADVRRAFAFSERGRIRSPQERRAWGHRIVTIDELQRRLQPDTAVTILHQRDHHLQVWVIRHDDVATHTIPVTRTRAVAMIAAHLDEVVRGTSSPSRSGHLFDAVIRPVSHQLRTATNVVFVADAPYDRIAFAALWNRARDRFVMEDHRVAIAPSATAYAWSIERSRERRTRPTLRQASIIGIDPDSVASNAVADGLSEVYGGARLKRAASATPTEFASDVSARDVVHVAAPVVISDQYPGLSRFVMADEPGRRYSGSAFPRLLAEPADRRAELVSFESGPGRQITTRTEGTLGMARTLLAAGVSSVVGPVAGIDRTSARQTWLDFHRHVAAGLSAAESLHRAQLAALSESDRRPGPWATLTVFGSTQ